MFVGRGRRRTRERRRAAGAEPSGQDLQYALSVGALYSDNIDRTPTNEETATVGTAGFDLRARREGSRLSYRADSNLNYLNYIDTDLSDQVVGHVNGSATTHSFRSACCGSYKTTSTRRGLTT